MPPTDPDWLKDLKEKNDKLAKRHGEPGQSVQNILAKARDMMKRRENLRDVNARESMLSGAVAHILSALEQLSTGVP